MRKYIEENNDEVREEAAKLYKEEHEGEEAFKRAARRLLADEM